MDAAERISLLLIEDDESHVALIERAFEAWQSLFDASSRDIFGCSKNRQNRIVENSTYPLDDFGFR